jgi:hypothetical protein
MKLFIEKESKVEDVKNMFNKSYPFLKIELYKKPFNDIHTGIKKEQLVPGANLNKFIHASGKTIIDISKNVTVSELENQFADIGLIAEVFRKSGNVWIESSLTDNWTLQQQNAEGEEISKHFSDKKSFSQNDF